MWISSLNYLSFIPLNTATLQIAALKELMLSFFLNLIFVDVIYLYYNMVDDHKRGRIFRYPAAPAIITARTIDPFRSWVYVVSPTLKRNDKTLFLESS